MSIFRAFRPANFYTVNNNGGGGEVVRATGSEIVVEYGGGAYRDVFTGTFAYDAAGTLTGGRVDRIEVADRRGTFGELIARPPLPAEAIASDYVNGFILDVYETTFAGVDQLYGSGLADGLRGFEGDDVLRGGGGGDALGGDGGRDTAAYDLSPSGVNVQLYSRTALFGDAQGDRLASVENLLGSNFNDVLAGDAGANVLTGRGGNDRLNGVGGNDLLRGGAGADRLDGSAGVDTAAYDTSTNGVNVQLQSGLTLYADAQGDQLFNVENLIGSRFNDVFSGNAGVNVLSGGAGNDTLRGLGGGDVLIGGPGTDRLEGAGGRDVFRLTNLGGGVDLVTDFARGGGGDVLDLTAIVDAGSGEFDVEGYVRLVAVGTDARLQVDPNGFAGGSAFADAAVIRGGAGLTLDELLAGGNLLVE